MNPLDELQTMLDERFPRGAHVWVRWRGELAYVTARPLVLAEHRIALPPIDSERENLYTWTTMEVTDEAVTFMGEEDLVIRLDHNFTPTDRIDLIRGGYGPDELDSWRRWLEESGQ